MRRRDCCWGKADRQRRLKGRACRLDAIRFFRTLWVFFHELHAEFVPFTPSHFANSEVRRVWREIEVEAVWRMSAFKRQLCTTSGNVLDHARTQLWAHTRYPTAHLYLLPLLSAHTEHANCTGLVIGESHHRARV